MIFECIRRCVRIKKCRISICIIFLFLLATLYFSNPSLFALAKQRLAYERGSTQIHSCSAEQKIGRKQNSAPGSRCTCKKRHQPSTFAESQSFHSLNASFHKDSPCAIVYSAFFDPRDQAVKVVSDSDTCCYRSINVTCQIWYNSSNVPYVSCLEFYHHMLEEEREARLGVLYSCSASPDASLGRPFAVSFFAKDDECMCSPMVSMRIHEPQPPLHEFAACIPPLFGDVSDANLAAFVEMHRLLGVEKFYFYKENVTKQVDELLQSYQNKGVAEVLSWKSKYPGLSTYHNQQAMQEDCLLRNLEQSTWVVQLDRDEVIVPANGLNLSEVVKAFGRNDTGAFIVLHREYTSNECDACDNVNDSSTWSTAASQSGSRSSGSSQPIYFKRLWYRDVSYKARDRSKIMYSPSRTEEARTHYSLPRNGYKEVVLGYDQATLRHYRDQQISLSTNFVLDKTICAFSEKLMPRLSNFSWVYSKCSESRDAYSSGTNSRLCHSAVTLLLLFYVIRDADIFEDLVMSHFAHPN